MACPVRACRHGRSRGSTACPSWRRPLRQDLLNVSRLRADRRWRGSGCSARDRDWFFKGWASIRRPRNVRGVNVNHLRYIYTIVGGALVGLAGPAYSLSIKAGWKGDDLGARRGGWIALAITILRRVGPACGRRSAPYLFGFLQWLGLVLQPTLPGVPSQVLQVAPFPLMILTLLLVNLGNRMDGADAGGDAGRVRRMFARLVRFMRASPPAALGVPFGRQ